jgi:hypothetical protein
MFRPRVGSTDAGLSAQINQIVANDRSLTAAQHTVMVADSAVTRAGVGYAHPTSAGTTLWVGFERFRTSIAEFLTRLG